MKVITWTLGPMVLAAVLAPVGGFGCRAARPAPNIDGLGTAPALPDTRPAGAPPQPIRVEPLRNLSVIGRLDLPLGTVTDVGATIISGKELNDKGHQSEYLLRVSQIAGRGLDKPMVMEFEVPSFISVGLANHVFDLYELKHGERMESLQPEQIKEIERGYVGRTVHLGVYETGSFSGIPSNLPPELAPWQDRAFGFSTRLVVLEERP